MFMSRLRWLTLLVLIVGFLGFLVISVNAVFAVDRTSTTAAPTCRDTDGGEDVYVKGMLSVFTPTYGNQTVVEYCTDARRASAISGDYVEELVCLSGDPTYAYTHKWTRCVNGCRDGACVATAPVVVTPAVETPVVRYDASAKSAFMAPADGAVLTNYPRTAELQWTPITSARVYEVEVACDVCGSTKWENVNKLTSSAVYLTTPALAGDNQFRARVRAVYPDGTNSQWSDYLYFNYKTAPAVTTPTESAVTQPKIEEPKVTESTVDTAVQPTDQTSGEAVTEEVQPVVESKPIVAPKVAEKKVGRMSCGNSAGGDGLYSACLKDTIKLDNKINITVRTYGGNYAWLTVKGAKQAYYRVKLGDSIDVVSKNGKDTISVSYVKKSPKFGVFLQIETAE